MLFDINGKVVNEGNYMVEADEETADFFKVVNGKLEYYARWGFATHLNLIDNQKTLDMINSLPETNEHERFLKEYHLKCFNRKQNMDASQLYLVTGPQLIALLEELPTRKKIKVQVEDHICLIDKD